MRVRAAAPGELTKLWPESLGLMPPEFGRDVDRLCMLELTRELDSSEGEPPDFDAMLSRMARADGPCRLGEALIDQSLVAGIGNMWMAEALWRARLSPWRRLRDVTADERRAALETAARLMRASVDSGRDGPREVYRRAGRPCPRCGTPIQAWGQGDANRTAYWCRRCQVGDEPSVA